VSISHIFSGHSESFLNPLEKKWKWKEKWKISIQDKEWGVQDWTMAKRNTYYSPIQPSETWRNHADHFIVFSEAWTGRL